MKEKYILLKFYIITISLIKNINGYSKVLISGTMNGTNSNLEEKPNIIKALNMDLIFPKIFNTTDSISMYDNNGTETTIESTGRAIDSRKPFQFPRISANMKPNYWNTGQKNSKYPVYRAPSISQAEINKLRGAGGAMDRYTPAEGAYKNLYELNKKNQKFRTSGSQKTETIAKPNTRPNSASFKPPNTRPNSASYVPPKNVYSFPPNINSKYPPPKLGSPSSQVSSYLPPPSGPYSATQDVSSYVPAPSGPDIPSNGFVGPVNPDYLPASITNMDDGKNNPAAAANEMNGMASADMGETMGSNDDKHSESQDGDGHQDDHSDHGDHSDDHSSDMQDNSPDPDHDHPMPPLDHDHPMSPPDHDHGPYYDEKEYPTPPPGYMPDYHDNGHDHDHDHHTPHFFHHHPHHTPHFFHHHPWEYGSHGIDVHPEIIHDDHDHDHHHHHHIETPPPPPPPTTTEPPPEPQEPRVKKYSYFYLGRKLWYIPLYFTVWFSFYVLWLIIKSIARHKVNLPNHVQRRSLLYVKNGITNLTHKEATQYIDELTINVMDKIENFKNKL